MARRLGIVLPHSQGRPPINTVSFFLFFLTFFLLFIKVILIYTLFFLLEKKSLLCESY